MPTTVLLIDDHELIRNGLRRAFERDTEFSVVGEAGSLQDGIATAEVTLPDVVVIDVRLPDGSGLDGVRALRSAFPHMGIVVLTMYASDEALLRALDAGASGFVSKDARAEDVLAAARHAAALPHSFTSSALAHALQRRLAPQGPQLSPRELDVLRLLAQGLPVGSIARELYVSVSTVKTHV